MYAHVVACTGWTWDYIAESVDLPRLKALNHYWADHPPTHALVAAYMGVEPSIKPDASEITEASEYIPVATVSKVEFDELLKQHGLPVSGA